MKKFILIPLLLLAFLGPILAPFAQSFAFPDRYDLVAILVEKGIYSDSADYDGLVGQAAGPINITTLKARIDRYAIDIQNKLPATRAVIIQVDRFEKPQNVASVLERLYFEGDPKEPLRTAYLRGAVLIGEVPLPVVKRDTNRYISLFPYTDFEQKAYTWNSLTQEFEFRTENPSPQPEIWHGVIRPPITTQSLEGRKQLASYFDKNHLFHTGEPAFANFSKRVFFQDFFHEKKNLNAESYKRYLAFLDHMDDIAYFRYTKELYKDLAGSVEDELKDDKEDAAALAQQLKDFGIPFDESKPQPQLPADAEIPVSDQPLDTSAVPDILTKVGKMTDNLMLRFNQIFAKYPELINDFIKYTGRYTEKDSAVNLIAAKDTYTMGYLKAVNEMVEAKIDEIVSAIQRPIPIIREATIDGFPLVNFSPEIWMSGQNPFFANPAQPPQKHKLGDQAILGTPFGEITSVSQCSFFRGSKGAGQYSKLVEANHAFNEKSALEADNTLKDETAQATGNPDAPNWPPRCNAFAGLFPSIPDFQRKNCPGFFLHGGCFYTPPPYDPYGPKSWCYPLAAMEPIVDLAGTVKRDTAPEGSDDFRSCFNFNGKEGVEDNLENIGYFFTKVDDGDIETIEGRMGRADAIGRPGRVESAHPDQIAWKGPPAKTLGSVLRPLGFHIDTPAWKTELAEIIRDDFAPFPHAATTPNGKTTIINAIIDHYIPSTFFHKEPTVETLNTQARNMLSKELPVDRPRYVTFQKFDRTLGRVDYPDLFDEPSLDNYLQKLAQLEQQLNAFPRDPSVPPPCVSCLTQLVADAAEISASPPGKDIVLSRANRTKVLDSINWKNMDVDGKHAYLAEQYLDSTKSAYIGESLNGYELAYFHGEGRPDRYEFSLPPEFEDEEAVGSNFAEEKEAPYVDDPNSPFDDEPKIPQKPEGGYDLISFSPPPISPWWERMKEWAAETKETISDFSFGIPGVLFYGKLDEETEAARAQIEEESEAVESALAMGEDPVLTRIAQIELQTESTTVVAGKRANVKLLLKDKNGALVKDEIARATLVLEGEGGEFSSDMTDENTDKNGLQITVFEGAREIGILAPDHPAGLTLKVSIEETEAGAELGFAVVNDAKLILESNVTAVIADDAQQIEVNISARNSANQILTEVNGTVSVGVSDPLLGRIVEEKITLISGQGKFHFKAGKKRGKAVLNTSLSSLDPGSLTLDFLPGAPVSLAMTSSSETLAIEPGAFVSIEASLMDANGNIVDTASGIPVKFKLTEKTKLFGLLGSESEQVQNGSATVIVAPREQTGAITVVAESAGLKSASVTVKALKTFGAFELKRMKPETLAVSLLGIPAGNVTEPDYLGGWFTMQGKTLATNSLTTYPKPFAKLFEITDRGGLKISDDSRISAHFLPSNNFTLVLRDNQLQMDLAELAIYTLEESKYGVIEETDPAAANPELLADGIYMKKLSGDSAYRLDKMKGAIRFVKGDAEKLEIQTNGFMRIFDNDFSIKPVAADFLTLDVMDKNTAVAQIIFVQRFNQDVRIKQEVEVAPGVYVKSLKLPPQIFSARAFMGNSTALPRGVAFFDKTQSVAGPGTPGFSFQSLEDTFDRFGVGFTQDNKFGLLFSGGEMFGEANRPYASDIGIVLGDPTIRLNNREEGTFSRDTGKLLYTAATDVRAMLSLDYNNDGFEDILIVEDGGRIRLIQNNGGYDRMKDQGYLISVRSGIQDLTKVDFNHDGAMDIVIAGSESCRKKDTCLDVYENQNGAFIRRNIAFDQTDKVMSVRAEDLNRDSFPELILADAGGDIKILYNKKGEFETASQVIGNVGLKVNSAQNLIQTVLIRYAGMDSKRPNDPMDALRFQTLTVKEPNPAAAQAGFGNFFGADSGEAKVEEGLKSVQRDFVYADLDSAFKTSTKFGEDLNGGVMKGGDRVRYTITLTNSSAALKQGISISDVVSESLDLDFGSIRCSDCAAGEVAGERLDTDPARPFLIKNLRVPPNSSRHIAYEAVFKGDTSTSDKIIMAFNSDFEDLDPAIQASLDTDDFPDISVTKEGNPTGRVRYFYTTGVSADGRLTWGETLSSPAPTETIESFKEKTGLDIPSEEDILKIPVKCKVLNPPNEIPPIYETFRAASKEECIALGGEPGKPAGPPPIAEKMADDLANKDSDGDGLQDSIDDISGGLDQAAEVAQAAVNKLTCDAGCIALPVNVALLSPGFWSILGVPDGYDIGLPVFGWGAPNIIPTWPPNPPLSTLGGRFYVSPTLTGGIGFSVCLGSFNQPGPPPPAGNCFSFGVNPLDMIAPGICDSLSGATSGALAKANSVVSKANEGMVVTLGAKGGTTGTGGRQSSGSGLGNYSLGSYESPVAKNRNIRIPGFPSIIADWMAAQWEEITDKALSLPDIYLIYPSGDSILGAFKPTEKFSRTGNLLTNVLSYINSRPLMDIQTQEVLFKVPALTRKEIERFKADARQWVEDEKFELERWRNLLGCIKIGGQSGQGKVGNQEICNFVTVEMNDLMRSLVDNMRALDEWILFPKRILQFRQIESFYVGQIIDYLDTIIEFTGGWTKRNIARVKQWQKAIRQIKKTIEDWKLFVRLMIDYNESCDKCKTERYGLKELLMKLFVALPQPPVIPLPKLPDLVVDVSKIQAGLTVFWPDVKFKAEPFTIPKLPRIKLGINLDIPMFKILVGPLKFNIPKPPPLPTLDPLPPLKIGKLPDIPPPPTLPQLPGEISAVINLLKKVVKILCIIRSGFMPTPEAILKTRIEEITARPLSPVLPIDLLFTVQTPTINVEYVDQLKVTAFTNLKLETQFILEKVQEVAKEANEFSTALVKGVNKYTDAFSKQLEKAIEEFITPDIQIKPGAAGREFRLNYKEDLTRQISLMLGQDASELVEFGLAFRDAVHALNRRKPEYERMISAVPDKLVLGMEMELKLNSENNCYDELVEPRQLKNCTLRQAQGDKNRQAQGDNRQAQGDKNTQFLPFQERLLEYRNSLTAYLEDNQRLLAENSLAENFDDWNRVLASQRSPFELGNFKKYIAANDFSLGSLASSKEPVKLGPLELENVEWIKEDDDSVILSLSKDDTKISFDRLSLTLDARLLAQNIPGAPPQLPLPEGMSLPSGPGMGGPSGSGTIEDIGIFFIDPNGQSRRLINYTLEANSSSQLADLDMDNDGDFDKLYSYGPNVFLKRNDRIEEEPPAQNFRAVDIEFWTLSELIPKGTSANFPSVVSETAHESNVTFEKPVMGNTVGFEVVARNSPAFFENAAPAASIRSHLFLDPAQPSENPLAPEFSIQNLKGDILVNGAKITEKAAVKLEDLIETGDGSTVTLKASDGTLINIAEETSFDLLQGALYLKKGRADIVLPMQSLLYPAGSLFSAGDGEMFVKLFDGTEVAIDEDYPFTLPQMQPTIAFVKVAAGAAEFTGKKREFFKPGDEIFRAEAGELVHSLGFAKLKWKAEEEDEEVYELTPGALLAVPDSLSSGVPLEVDEGFVEIIRNEDSVQQAAAGMALQFGDTLKVTSGTFVIQYPHGGGEFTLSSNETFKLQKTENLSSPNLQLAIDPGFYFAKVYSIDRDGNRGTASEKVLLSPQVCGDSAAPIANAGKAKFQVAVGKTLEIDALRSLDPGGKIISYNLDVDTSIDSNGDGIAYSDRDISQGEENSKLTIGPYPEVGAHQMRLIVEDEAQNEGYQDITVEVITPRIVLDAPPLRENIIQGYVEPPEENVPITIARLRPGPPNRGWEILKTPTADEGSQYFTNTDGVFRIEDADLRERMVVRDSEGKVIAEIDVKTGRINTTDARYEIRFIPGSGPPQNLPSRVGLFLKTDPSLASPLTSVYFVPDVNTDATIDGAEVSYDSKSVSRMSGIHIKPLAAAQELGIDFSVVPGDDPAVPGAAQVTRGDKRIVVIDVNGDMVTLEKNISMRLKEAPDGSTEPVVFEMISGNQPIAEVFVPAELAGSQRVTLVDQPSPIVRPKPQQKEEIEQPFTDIAADDPFSEVVERLFARKIIAGYPSKVKGELLFKPENFINRAEFTQITLKMLCIVPREEAHKLPTPFYDVLDPKLWFYPVLKEGNIRGFIKGYVGEAKQNPETGVTQTPFKPANNITRAEAATVVLAALAEEGIIDVKNFDFKAREGRPWYDRYVELAQNFEKYLVDKKPGREAFLITKEEAVNPDKPITRREFALMADRVLLFYDCANPDSDADGLDDLWELDTGKPISEIKPEDDLDGDSCINKREFELGTDPLKADTDAGGIPDCAEDAAGTDPLNAFDDREAVAAEVPKEIAENQEGIFVVQPACTSCPCRASIEPGADLNLGDILFAAITGKNGLPIYAKSNEEKY